MTATVIRALPDGLEDNERRDAAHDLGLQTSVVTYGGLNVLDDSTDWYRFRIADTADRRHVVKINFKESLGDLTLAIYNADGKLVRSGTQRSNKELIPLNKLSAGTYYARVKGQAHPNYKLTIDAPEPKVVWSVAGVSVATESVATGSVTTASVKTEAQAPSSTWTLFNSKRRILHDAML